MPRSPTTVPAGSAWSPWAEHAGGLTHNALVGFQDGSYLELFAFRELDRSRGAHPWAAVAERGGGWADVALRSDDLLGDSERVQDLVVRACFVSRAAKRRDKRTASPPWASIVLGARDPAAVTVDHARLAERGAPAIEIRQAERDGPIDVQFE
jgi:hypothetical protein